MTAKNGSWPEHMHYNPVNVADTIGVIFLGILALSLLLALLRAEARNRKLLNQLQEACQEARGG